MAWYKTGTVLVGLNNTVITGTGTKFAANARVGDGFRGPDGNWYEIVNIASETVLSIFPAYKGASVSSTDWMIAPLQGYNKESADRLRAITDSFPTQIDAKQDKNKNLTGLSIAPSVNNSVPVFDGTGGSMKSVPIATTYDTDDTHIAHIGSGGLMGSNPINLLPSVNADQLPLINGRYVFQNGGVNIPTPYCYIDNYVVNGNYFRQVARDLTSNRTWERQFLITQANQPWVQTTKAGDYGLGGLNFFNGNIDQIVSLSPNGVSFYTLTSAATGPLPPGTTTHEGNTLHVDKWDGNNATVIYRSRGAMFVRGVLDGSWTSNVWNLIYNSANILNPVTSARWGIMDDTTVGSWRISRFYNGYVTMSAPVAAVTVPANNFTITDFTTPIGTPDWGKSIVTVNIAASADNAHFGVISQYMDSPTGGKFIIRNGGTAQQFGLVRINISGYWK